MLFNNSKASAAALLLSIKADQALTFTIVKAIEDMVNRFVQEQPYGKNFKVTFLNWSQYNAKELGDAYLKAATYGMPTISMYCASQGLGQAEMDCMSFLEDDVLGLKDMFDPLRSSATMSGTSDGNGATDDGGAPKKEDGDLSDSGEKSREQE